MLKLGRASLLHQTAKGRDPWQALNNVVKYPINTREERALFLQVTRPPTKPITNWGGGADEALRVRVRNYSSSGSTQGGWRAGLFQTRNDGSGYWMRSFDVENDNRGTIEEQIGAYIYVNNVGTVSDKFIGLEIYIRNQAAQQATLQTALNIRLPSQATGGAQSAIRIIAEGTPKFTYGIDFYGDGARQLFSSACMRFKDDGVTADIADSVTTVNGAIKVLIDAQVSYIPTYATYNAV